MSEEKRKTEIIDGKYLNAGDIGLYVKILGEGGPAVIIEPGWGCLSAEWTDIQHELAEYTTVITYDRAGVGESKMSKDARSSEKIVDELYAMLANTQIQGPFIFVGAQAGGLYVQHFARKYPDVVGAVVFADTFSTNYQALDKLDLPEYNKTLSLPKKMLNISNFVKLDKEKFQQYIPPLVKDLYPDLPEAIRQQLIEYQCDQNFYRTIVEEYHGMEASVEEIETAGEFPQIPITVLSHDNKYMEQITRQLGVPEEEAKMIEIAWLEHQKQITELSKMSAFEMVQGAHPSMHVSSPDKIIDAVLALHRNFGSVLEIG